MPDKLLYTTMFKNNIQQKPFACKNGVILAKITLDYRARALAWSDRYPVLPLGTANRNFPSH
jgi:hypothetical protein